MIKLIAVGDINIGNDRAVVKKINYNQRLAEIFKATDLCVANLEGPITNAGNEPLNGDFGLYSDFGVLKFLKNYGINLVSLANNHINDYGPLCVEFTIDFLRENNIRFFGWGKNLSDILMPNIIEINGLKIGLVALTLHDGRFASTYMPGVLPVETSYYIPLIKKTREICDFLLCSIHWGYEMYIYPSPDDRRLAYTLIDNGVDLIIGHHPHVIQGYEIYNNKHIFYSLGNFVFKSFWYKGNKQLQSEESKKTMCIEFDIESQKIKSFKVNPIYYDEDLSIRIIENNEKEIFLNHFQKISDELNNNNYKSFFLKYRIAKEFPIKEKIKEILNSKLTNLSIIPRFFRFIKKFIKIVILHK